MLGLAHVAVEERVEVRVEGAEAVGGSGRRRRGSPVADEEAGSRANGKTVADGMGRLLFAYGFVCDVDLLHTTAYVDEVPRKPARSVKSPLAKVRPKAPRTAATRHDAKQRTRAALVQAALELFGEQGLDVPSLDAICDRAGYTRGAFYVHFKTREDILVAVMDHVGALFLAGMFEGLSAAAAAAAATAATAGKTRAPRLQHAMRRFVDMVGSGAYPLMATTGKGPLVRPHQLLDACARSAVVRERYRELVGLSLGAVAGLVRSDQEDGEVRKDVEPETVASMALALVIGAQTMADLGMPLDAGALAGGIEKMLARP